MKLPNDWQLLTVGDIADVKGGKRLPKGSELVNYSTGYPYIRVTDMFEGGVRTDQIRFVPVDVAPAISRYRIFRGELFITVAGTLGVVGEIPPQLDGANLTENADKLTNIKIDLPFLKTYLQSQFIKKIIDAEQTQNAQPKLAIERINAFPIPIPPRHEQVRIAKVISTWDAAIEETERLIAAKQKRNEALSNRLLFGHARFGQRDTKTTRALHWFSAPSDWQITEIGKVASEVSTLNSNDDNLLILSCTKHEGLVDSLKYFDKKVFSHDTSKSKIVRRGQFAYATNHIEEGSIGYQDLVPAGLVSPIYTVFQADAEQIFDSYFYKLLKTEKMRQIFAAQTNASVDRRGSLRWKEFARIHIPLPPLDEQREISAVLDEAKREVALLQAKVEALKTQKRGLMQKLLTGQWRLKIAETEAG